VSTCRTGILDLVGLQLVADVTLACAVLSTHMAAQRTAPKHQREQGLSGCTLSGKDAYLACKMFL
jgi:hypothetical protein